MKTTSELDKVFLDGPIVQMMLDVVYARVRTSEERFGIKPDFIVFPQYFRTALAEELGESNPPEKFMLLGVKIEWQRDV